MCVRDVEVQRPEPDMFRATVGDEVLDLSPAEAWALRYELDAALDKPDQQERLRAALAQAQTEVYDILKNDEYKTRAFDLTKQDWDALVWLSIRIQSPWE